jgi:ferredoxin
MVSVTGAVEPGVLSAQHAWWLPERDDPADEVFWCLNVNALLPSGQQGRSGLGYPFRCIPCALEAFDGDTSLLPAGPALKAPPLLEPAEGGKTSGEGAILVDPWLCTGCGSCEIACLSAHRIEDGVLGIRVLPVPERPGEQTPRITAACDLCASTPAGVPSCSAHCPSGCLLLPDDQLPGRRTLRFEPGTSP